MTESSGSFGVEYNQVVNGVSHEESHTRIAAMKSGFLLSLNIIMFTQGLNENTESLAVKRFKINNEPGSRPRDFILALQQRWLGLITDRKTVL